STTFLQGTYTTTVIGDTIYDSLQVVGNNVTEYTVLSSTGMLENDIISPISSSLFWEATSEKTYDGITGALISTEPVSPDGSIIIDDLTYKLRYPSKFEIMSFVTPYGINLDMGINGKTWLFDITDFAPILNGSKRLNMQAGGQWQEDMDIRFLFIVGTPPRDVLDIQQIWKSDAQRNYGDILSDRYFAPRDLPLRADGEYFKVRTSITGHGSQGEFIGRSHYLDLNGGSLDFNWQVWKECALNPVFPQGGTWIYDRAGWCPGMATDIRENDITDLVSAGSVVNIDYGVATASGDSRYFVNNQLVSYGAANFSLDAAVVEIAAPSNRVEYARTSTICTNPKVIIKNTGSSNLTELEIEYWVNGGANRATYSWTGNLDFMEQETVILPTDLVFWTEVEGNTGTFHVEIKAPNGGADEYQFNNTYSSDFVIPSVLPGYFTVWFTTNTAGNESKYQIFNEAGDELFVLNGTSGSAIHRDTFLLDPGCYSLVLSDTDDDGIDFWANSDGVGSLRIRDAAAGTVLENLEGDFGRSVVFNFTIDFALALDPLDNDLGIRVFPNPASDYLIVDLVDESISKADIKLLNLNGQEMQCPFSQIGSGVQLNTSALPTGLYFLHIEKEGISKSIKVVIE
ncbi:MAG: hypothetical protein ACI959_001149, partial [Limisphaerales bacterium]